MAASAPLPPALDAPRNVLHTSTAGAVSYYCDSRASGRPLVLLHSVNAAPSAIEMKPLFEHYRGHRPVFAPELPGFGHSDRADMQYTPALYAEALQEFLTRVSGGDADVIALSLSAEYAARVALLDSRLVRSLTLISPTGLSHRRPPGGIVSERIHRVLRLPLLGAGLFRMLRSRPSIRYFLGLAFEGKAPEQLIDYAWVTTRRDGASHAPFCFLSGKLFTRDAFESLYMPLTQPVLVLYDRDANVRFDRLDELLSARPNWQALRISPTLGMPHWEQTARTVQALDAFWGHAPA
jgi:pimeloyl-ACP methyl ester carboxylesterase